jgi:transcriptional regulator with XRE-family HTH domain
MLAALGTRDIATVFRQLQRLGLTQRRIADRTGQAQSEISEIISGRQVVTYDVLVRIADRLGTPRGYLGLAYLGPTHAEVATADLDCMRVPPEPPQIEMITHVVTAKVTTCARCGDTVVPPVRTWTSPAVRALMKATRTSVRRFAREIGVSDRMVSKWTSPRSTVVPRPSHQDALDAVLRLADAHTRRLFTVLLAEQLSAAQSEADGTRC